MTLKILFNGENAHIINPGNKIVTKNEVHAIVKQIVARSKNPSKEYERSLMHDAWNDAQEDNAWLKRRMRK